MNQKKPFSVRFTWGKPARTEEYTIQATTEDEAREWGSRQAKEMGVPCSDKVVQVLPLQGCAPA